MAYTMKLNSIFFTYFSCFETAHLDVKPFLRQAGTCIHSVKIWQTYFKDLAVFTHQDFKSIFGHFSTLCMKGLREFLCSSPF